MSLEGMMLKLKLQYFGHLMSEGTLGDGDEQGGLVCCDGVAKSQTGATELN